MYYQKRYIICKVFQVHFEESCIFSGTESCLKQGSWICLGHRQLHKGARAGRKGLLAQRGTQRPPWGCKAFPRSLSNLVSFMAHYLGPESWKLTESEIGNGPSAGNTLKEKKYWWSNKGFRLLLFPEEMWGNIHKKISEVPPLKAKAQNTQIRDIFGQEEPTLFCTSL